VLPLLAPFCTTHDNVWLAGGERRSSLAGILRSKPTAENLQETLSLLLQ